MKNETEGYGGMSVFNQKSKRRGKHGRKGHGTARWVKKKDFMKFLSENPGIEIREVRFQDCPDLFARPREIKK